MTLATAPAVSAARPPGATAPVAVQLSAEGLGKSVATPDGELVIRAEMPGIDPDDDVEITVTDHRLHVKAERRSETKEEDVTGWRSEFRYGSFERTMPLPHGATEDDVTATYEDGILEIRVPIDEDADTTKKIPVTRAA